MKATEVHVDGAICFFNLGCAAVSWDEVNVARGILKMGK